jgi:hypothetical protein
MTRLRRPGRYATSGGWSIAYAGRAVRSTRSSGSRQEASSSDSLQRITAARGAINELMAEFLEEHVREYLSPADCDTDPRQADAAEELIEIIHTYLT